MMRIKTLVWATLAVALAALSAEAQRQAVGGTANKPLAPRQLTRGKLWHAYENSGASGARPTGSSEYTLTFTDLDYPGFSVANGNDFTEYYGLRATAAPGANNYQVDMTNHNGRGHGWWIAAQVDGKASVSYGNPLIKTKEESADVFMMAVDPTKDLGGRFANVGNNLIDARSGRSRANWWPGTPIALDAGEPREILNFRVGQYTDAAKDNTPEDIILSKWTTKQGLTGTKAAFAWNHPEYDDFIIEEWTFENTGDTNGDRAPDLPGGGHNLKNVYFAFQHRLMTSSAGTSRGSYTAYFWDWGPGDGCGGGAGFGAADNGQDDKIKYTEAPNYDGPASAKGLKMTYAYDWNNWCWTGSYADDVGDPWRGGNRPSSVAPPTLTVDGDLLSPAWIGWAEIDVDPTDGFVGDNAKYEAPKVAQQPFAHNMFWFQGRQSSIAQLGDLVGDEPDPTKMSDDTLYQMITRSPATSYFNSDRLARPSRGSGDPNKGVPLLPLSDNPTGPMPYVPNPDWEWKNRPGIAAAYTVMDAYGPYDLAPGQKVKFVFAYVAGAPVEDNVREFQRKKDSSELKKEENGAAFANLVKHLKKAQEAYALGYDLPNQPPDVDVTVASSENARVKLTWSDAADKSINPDTGKPDVAGYHIYQAATLPDQWKQVADIKVGSAASGTYSLEDQGSLAGFQYFYSVRAYQGSANAGFKSRVTGKGVDGGVSAYESGVGDPSTFYYPPTGETPFSPVQAASAAADRLEKNLLIVPNPYFDDRLHGYEGTPKIRILNVPRRCKIRIYTVAGDLVGQMDFDSATEGEAAYFQLNKTATTPLTFGIYLVTVESLMPESLGKVKRASFVVIR